MQVTLYGGVGTVTGSKHLVEDGDARVLVDCGLFQGVKLLRERNRKPFPFTPSSLDAVILTHAHIDHSGMLPALVKDGFKGRVYCTPATRDLAEILLRDSARLHEEDAAYANRKGFSRHQPAEPLYTEEDAERALKRLVTVGLNKAIDVCGMEVRFQNAGHILGAAHVTVRARGRSVVFSGDVGRADDPLMLAPEPPPPGADLIVLESTYGDRIDPPHPEGVLADVLDRTMRRGGVLLIPAFAVGRSQALLYELDKILDERPGPRPPVFLNSPMATSATEIYAAHSELLRLSGAECRGLLRDATFVRSTGESKALDRRAGPMVVVSASGMLTGGRVLHHLKSFGPDARNTILLSGFQAPGTRGGRLVDGERELKVHGQFVPIRAEVQQVGGYSAHADQRELIDWLRSAPELPRRVLLNHGEPAASDALRVRISDELGIPVSVGEAGEPVQVGADPVHA